MVGKRPGHPCEFIEGQASGIEAGPDAVGKNSSLARWQPCSVGRESVKSRVVEREAVVTGATGVRQKRFWLRSRIQKELNAQPAKQSAEPRMR